MHGNFFKQVIFDGSQHSRKTTSPRQCYLTVGYFLVVYRYAALNVHHNLQLCEKETEEGVGRHTVRTLVWFFLNL